MCGPGDTRWAKRSEARQAGRDLATELEDYRVDADPLARLREVAARLPQQEDEGDLSWLAAEVEEWAGLRRAATTVLLGGDGDNPASIT